MEYLPYTLIAILALWNIRTYLKIVSLEQGALDNEKRTMNHSVIMDRVITLEREVKNCLNKSHAEEIRYSVIKIANEIGLEEIGCHSVSLGENYNMHMLAQNNSQAYHVNVPHYFAGRKFDAKVNAAIQNSGDPRVDHLVKTKPDLFLRRFATEEVEITRATSAGEETIKGSIGKIASTDRGAMIFEIISPEKGIVQVKHSEIINFKTKDK